jgi:hypothetical protein
VGAGCAILTVSITTAGVAVPANRDRWLLVRGSNSKLQVSVESAL